MRAEFRTFVNGKGAMRDPESSPSSPDPNVHDLMIAMVFD